MKYITTINEQEFLVDVLDEHHVMLNGRIYQIDFETISDQPVYSLLVEGKSHEAYVYPVEEVWQVLHKGQFYQARVEDEAEKRLKSSSGAGVSERAEFFLKAPMPGLVAAVNVSEGQEVKKGDVLVILESMKMQNELKSPKAGTITRIRIKPKERVEQRQTLMSVI